MTTRILKPGEKGKLICEFCGWPFEHTGDESGSQPIYCACCTVALRVIKEQVARANQDKAAK